MLVEEPIPSQPPEAANGSHSLRVLWLNFSLVSKTLPLICAQSVLLQYFWKRLKVVMMVSEPKSCHSYLFQKLPVIVTAH